MSVLSAFTRQPLQQETSTIFVYNCQEDSETSRHSLLQAKRESNNRDAAQQAFLIVLLVQFGYNIKVHRLSKEGKTMNQLFRIERIWKGERTYYDRDDCGTDDYSSKKKRKLSFIV